MADPIIHIPRSTLFQWVRAQVCASMALAVPSDGALEAQLQRLPPSPESPAKRQKVDSDWNQSRTYLGEIHQAIVRALCPDDKPEKSVHIDQLLTRLEDQATIKWTKAEILAAIDTLQCEGWLYTTTDDENWASVNGSFAKWISPKSDIKAALLAAVRKTMVTPQDWTEIYVVQTALPDEYRLIPLEEIKRHLRELAADGFVKLEEDEKVTLVEPSPSDLE